jgi:Fe2+ transport system protein FeoA
MDIVSSKSNTEIRLSDLKEGQTGRIVRVGGQGVLRRRLLEMGLIKGTLVYVEKYAPLKDPIELIVKGYHVSLRVEEAAQVILEEVRQELTHGSEAN